MSDDGHTTLVLIVMLGNVFSPRYRAARLALGSSVSPLSYSTFHVALGGQHARFALTETDDVERSPMQLRVGSSALSHSDGVLTAEIDERTAFGRRVVGRVRVELEGLIEAEVTLDVHGRHRWTPLAPAVRAEVELTTPSLRFTGHAYVDGNEGDEALESGFSQWSWARFIDSEGGACILYDTVDPSGVAAERTFRVGARGLELQASGSLQTTDLPPTLFRLSPSVRLDPGSPLQASRMQDAPFYARTLVRGQAFGRSVTGVHEWLDLGRFGNPWVQRMIPYRMRNGFPRRGDPRC